MPACAEPWDGCGDGFAANWDKTVKATCCKGCVNACDGAGCCEDGTIIDDAGTIKGAVCVTGGY